MKVYTIILAAGSGSRTGLDQNKMTFDCGGISLIEKTLTAFTQHERIDRVLLVCQKKEQSFFLPLKEKYACLLAYGGDTRTQSVKNALDALVGDPPDIVLIHDGARPFVSANLISRSIDAAAENGSAIAALPVSDTVAIAEDERICEYSDRTRIRLLQTPQTFCYRDILAAYSQITAEDRFLDDSGVYAKYIAPPHIIDGEQVNKKITYAADLKLLKKSSLSVGCGWDRHLFTSERPLILGGVAIASNVGLLGHSDADALTHAVMDALLSAANLRDIGCYFPDTDPQFKGACSLDLLRRTMRLIRDAGWQPVSISAVIICDSPKLKNDIDKMKSNLSQIIGVPVSVSATTTEGTESRSLTATATALCERI